MTVEIINADLFDVKADAYAHGVNCQGKMGKGIALEFKKRWPDNYRYYADECKAHQQRKNKDMWIVYPCLSLSFDGYKEVIFNLFTQIKTGQCAEYRYVYHAMVNMKEDVKKRNGLYRLGALIKPVKSIAMPFIGCGIGGLHKDGVEAIIRHVFDDWEGVVYICDLDGLKKRTINAVVSIKATT